MSGVIPKPNLRGHLNRQIGRHLIGAFTTAIISAVIFKVTIADPKKKKYAEFYKDYDPLPDFRRMRDLGLLQSARPGEGE